jgi:hypothetical protein
MLRPTELKNCLITAHRLDLQDEELDFQRAQVDLENDSLSRIEDQLNRDSQIPVSNQFELEEINQRIGMYNARLRTQNYTVRLYNQRVEAHSNEIGSWNRTCGDHKFYVYDLDNIKADLPFGIDQYIKRES